MFSKSCNYAIKASIFVAKHSLENKKVGFIDISKEIDSPQAFTAKILQTLVRANILNSIKGVHGGFFIDKEKIKTINLADIVIAIDGPTILTGCGIGLPDCSESHPCPVHHEFKHIKHKLVNMLENTNLEQLALGVKSGETFLRY